MCPNSSVKLTTQGTRISQGTYGCLGKHPLNTCWVWGREVALLGGAHIVHRCNKELSMCKRNLCSCRFVHQCVWSMLPLCETSLLIHSDSNTSTHFDGMSRIIELNVQEVLLSIHSLRVLVVHQTQRDITNETTSAAGITYVGSWGLEGILRQRFTGAVVVVPCLDCGRAEGYIHQ